MRESTVTTKGQTTLPKRRTQRTPAPCRRSGRYLILDGSKVRIVRSQPVIRLAGLLKGQSDRRLSLDDMEEAIARGAAGE